MYKRSILETIIVIAFNIIIATLNFLYSNEALNSLFIIITCALLLFVLYWLYELDKYALLSLLFGNFKKIKKNKRVLNIIICIVLFLITIFVYLIEYSKYIYLSEKLKEKACIANVCMLNKKTNKIENYKTHNFNNDNDFTIFIVEMKNINKYKSYIIFNFDEKYQLLKTYAEIFIYDDYNNEVALNYLALSYEAILYYKKEIKDIRREYNKKVKEYYASLKNDKEEINKMLKVQEYLLKTKLNNTRYTEMIRQMHLSPKYKMNNEIDKWHNYFKNETDKVLVKVYSELDACNNHFQHEILSKYKDSNEVKEKLNKSE